VLLLLLPQRPPLLQSRQPGQPHRWSPSKAAAGPSRAEGERGAAAPGQLAGLWGASRGEESVAGCGRPTEGVGRRSGTAVWAAEGGGRGLAACAGATSEQRGD
jgi:hypothetical protein